MIEVQDLRFSYPGADAAAVHDVTFTIPSGTIYGFLGPSGAGKSTVQNVLIRLLPLKEGAVRYDGKDLASLDRSFFRRVGVSFEHPNLFPRLTGLENLTCYAGLYGGAARDPKQLLERFGLAAHMDKKAEDYSKGMKQRLVLARSLLHAPDFLFLDEPTSGLDPTTTRDVLDVIREERDRGATLFITTHNMGVADTLCDNLAFLHGGRIVAEGSPRDLKLEWGERAVRVERRKEGGHESRRYFLDKPEDRAELQQVVASGDVETLHSEEATLEDIFVRITGRGLA